MLIFLLNDINAVKGIFTPKGSSQCATSSLHTLHNIILSLYDKHKVANKHHTLSLGTRTIPLNAPMEELSGTTTIRLRMSTGKHSMALALDGENSGLVACKKFIDENLRC